MAQLLCVVAVRVRLPPRPRVPQAFLDICKSRAPAHDPLDLAWVRPDLHALQTVTIRTAHIVACRAHVRLGDQTLADMQGDAVAHDAG